MSDHPTLPVDTTTLDTPGATLTCDVRRVEHAVARPLVFVGFPMGATGFATLGGHFPDRTVVRFDPRGVERSTKADPDAPFDFTELVDDLQRVLPLAGADPVDVFASSGGAVVALAAVATASTPVATLVAHEPPVLDVLPDATAARAGFAAVGATYSARGFGAGMAHFIALTSHVGPFDDDWADRPAPDPATFGMPTDDDGSRNDPLLSQDDTGIAFQSLDFAAIAAASTRVVVAAGVESENLLTGRAARAIAERLDTGLVTFPSGHGGFLGGEYGQTGIPDAFAAQLRAVLDQP